MGHVIHNMDILRLSVTFLAFATVVFILATSWTVFHSHGDHGSCRKLLESARDIKETIRSLRIDEEKLSNDLQSVSGQRSELLRAILASSIDVSKHPAAEEKYLDNAVLSKSIDYDNVATSNKRDESLNITDEKIFTMCVFGDNPETSMKLSREIHCKKPNVTVRLIHGTNSADVGIANVTFFTNTVQKYGWWSSLISARKVNQRWALASVHPPTTVHRETTVPKAFRNTIFHWTANYNYESDVPLLYGKYTSLQDSNDSTQIKSPLPKLQDKEKLVAFFTTDCTPAKWPRETFVSKLSDYIDVDILGCKDCGDDLACHRELKKYKFILALENAPCYGYISDVFWSALAIYESVPIVWGARLVDYRDMGPNKSYIDIRNHGSIKGLAEYIAMVNRSPVEYEKFHLWRHKGTVEVLMNRTNVKDFPNDSQVCSTFDKYIGDFGERPYFRDTNRDAWQGSCTIRPTDVIDNLPIPEEPKDEEENVDS